MSAGGTATVGRRPTAIAATTVASGVRPGSRGRPRQMCLHPTRPRCKEDHRRERLAVGSRSFEEPSRPRCSRDTGGNHTPRCRHGRRIIERDTMARLQGATAKHRTHAARICPHQRLGIQTLAFAARNPAIGSAKAHNPTCGSAFGERVCVTASPTGLTFKWSGYRYRAGTTETLGIQGTWAGPGITQHVQWSGSGTHTVFVRLKTPDDYAGWVSLESPEGGVSKFINFSLVVPQVGTSGLAVVTKSLPEAKLGIPYLFRLSARGGISTVQLVSDSQPAQGPDSAPNRFQSRNHRRHSSQGVQSPEPAVVGAGDSARHSRSCCIRVLSAASEFVTPNSGAPDWPASPHSSRAEGGPGGLINEQARAA